MIVANSTTGIAVLCARHETFERSIRRFQKLVEKDATYRILKRREKFPSGAARDKAKRFAALRRCIRNLQREEQRVRRAERATVLQAREAARRAGRGVAG